MKKELIPRILFIISLIFALAFVIFFVIDIIYYCTGGYMGSAPLYVYLIIRVVQFIFPALIAFIAAIITKKLFSRK